MNLMVEIDGEILPLAKCCWIQEDTCGCVVAVLTAAAGDEILATAEEAHKHLVPLKRERDKEVRDGFTFRLITMAHYRSDISRRWECAQHKSNKAAA